MSDTAFSLSAARPGIFARLRATFAEYREYSRTVAELQALSDRELRDLGISRYVIPEIAREAVRSK